MPWGQAPPISSGMDLHRVSLLARRCGLRGEQVFGGTGQARLASYPSPRSCNNECATFMWMASECGKRASEKMLDKVIRHLISTNGLAAIKRPNKVVEPEV